jgi:hypothetical protein
MSMFKMFQVTKTANNKQLFRFALSKGPNWVGVFPPHMRMEIDPVSETFSSFSNTGLWTKFKNLLIIYYLRTYVPYITKSEMIINIHSLMKYLLTFCFVRVIRTPRRIAKAKQEVLGRTNRLPSFWYDAFNNYYIVTCIHYLGNALTEPLPSNGKRIRILIHRLMGGIYEVRRWDGLRCHDIHIVS